MTSDTSVRPFPLLAVTAVSFFIMFGFGLVVPTLPLFADELGVKEAGVGLLLTVFSGARLAATFFTTPLLARLGERATAALGAAIVGVSSLSAGFAPSFGWLVVLRGFGGFGSAFFIGALMSALLGGVDASKRGRAMASFQGAVVSGFILGPAVGGLLARISLRAPLFIYGAICLIAAPLLLLALRNHASRGGRRARVAAALSHPEGLQTEQESVPPAGVPGWRALRPLLADSAFVGALAMGFTAFFVAGGVDTLLSRTWRFTLGQPEASVGIPFMIMGLTGLLPTFHAGRLADRRGRKFATIPALIASVPVLILLGQVSSTVMFVVLTGVLGMTWAYQRPGASAIIGDVTDDASRPAAVGALRISNDLGGFIGPVLVGVVAEHFGRGAGFLVASFGVLFGLVFMMRARETHGALATAGP